MARGSRPSLPFSTVESYAGRSTEHLFQQWQLFYQTSELLAEWKEAFDSAMAGEVDGNAFLSNSLRSGEELLRKHSEWAQNIPTSSCYTLEDIDQERQPAYLKPLLDLKAAPKKYHIYPTLQVALRHRISWFCQTLLIQAILHTRCYLDRLASEKLITSSWNLQPHDLEQLLAKIADELLASCTTCLMMTDKGEREEKSINELKSGQAFLMMWPCAALTLCLYQTPLQTTDLGHRFEYAKAIMSFLQEYLGFEKAGAYINFQSSPDPRPQLWMINSK
jgi:hypothetical protein